MAIDRIALARELNQLRELAKEKGKKTHCRRAETLRFV